MAAHLGKRLHLPQGVRWLWAMGLAVPILVGVALVIIIVVALVSPRYRPAEMITVGDLSRFQAGVPVYYADPHFWLVRLPSDRVVALYSVDRESGCPAPWHSQLEFRGTRGWFRDACTGSTYDLEGKCFSGPCTRGLDRLGVLLQSTEVLVKVREITNGPPADFSAKPVTPPSP